MVLGQGVLVIGLVWVNYVPKPKVSIWGYAICSHSTLHYRAREDTKKCYRLIAHPAGGKRRLQL